MPQNAMGKQQNKTDQKTNNWYTLNPGYYGCNRLIDVLRSKLAIKQTGNTISQLTFVEVWSFPKVGAGHSMFYDN